MPDRAVPGKGVVVLLLASILYGCSGTGASTVDANVEPERPVRRTSADRPTDTRSETPAIPAPPAAGSYKIYPRSSAPEPVPVSGYDLHHTELALTFDLRERAVGGTAVHYLEVTADSLESLPFHAFGLSIQSVEVSLNDSLIDATSTQEGKSLVIDVGSSLQAHDSVRVQIEYTARPHRTASKRGMFFVDPHGTDPSLPTQVWTLGQPEDNRLWFPTWDYPNDRMTFDISLTVPDSLLTVATGELVDVIEHEGSARTDRWILDVEQPAYLVAIAVGDFVELEDAYVSPVGKSVPLFYYAEPQFRDYIDLIYGISPDVIGVVERKTAVAYPFSNLKQVPVQEFTAGGMENSTVVLYDHRLQHDDRAHLDYTGRDLIVHEIAHQWFGNLVTCRSWAHLALNEGFANFFEQVYVEEAVGAADAQEHRIAAREEYLQEAKLFRRPIIWTEYGDPNLLFDSHTYEKAELVLNMLRFEIGDDAFWRGVRLYLTSSEDGSVSISNLKEAMERATRRPLTTFFEQWFFEPGHPELTVDHSYDDQFGLYQIRVRQTQDLAAFPTYAIEAMVELNYDTGATYTERVRIATSDTTFRFGVAGQLSFARFDEGSNLLADIVERKPVEQWLRQSILDDEMASRYDAVRALGAAEPDPKIMKGLLEVADSDEYDLVRSEALALLERYKFYPEVVVLARRLSLDDGSSRVRRSAVRLLATTRDPSALSVLRHALRDSSYLVVAEAAEGYSQLAPRSYMEAFAPILDLRSWDNIVEETILDVVMQHPDPRAEAFVLRQMSPVQPVGLRIKAVRTLASMADLGPDWKERVREKLKALGSDLHASVRTEASRLAKLL